MNNKYAQSILIFAIILTLITALIGTFTWAYVDNFSNVIIILGLGSILLSTFPIWAATYEKYFGKAKLEQPVLQQVREQSVYGGGGGGVFPSMQRQPSRITQFVTVQYIALVGWIILQSFFVFSPISRSISSALIIVIEAIIWIATLIFMFLLFRRTYNSFIKAVLDLEDANRRLRRATNAFLLEEEASIEQQQKQEEERSP